MIITFIRHGEVESTYQGCYNGHNNIALSHLGFLQAQTLAAHFESHHFDACYCSDLLRAKESFAPFKRPAIYTDALREKSWGRHEGQSYENICKIESWHYESFEQWINQLDGESIEQFQIRIARFYGELLLKNYDSVLIMTHAGVIRMFYYLLQNISLEEAFSLPCAYASFCTLDTLNSQFSPCQRL